jgi:hypothetical protein
VEKNTYSAFGYFTGGVVNIFVKFKRILAAEHQIVVVYALVELDWPKPLDDEGVLGDARQVDYFRRARTGNVCPAVHRDGWVAFVFVCERLHPNLVVAIWTCKMRFKI